MQHNHDDPGSNIRFVHGPSQIRSSAVHPFADLRVCKIVHSVDKDMREGCVVLEETT